MAAIASNYASVKLSGHFVDQARREAEVVHHSVGAQVEYRARLGRAVENTPGFGIDKVRQALDGQLKLEDLLVVDQDAAMAAFGAMFDAPSAELKAHCVILGAQEAADGAESKGQLVRRQALGPLKRVG